MNRTRLTVLSGAFGVWMLIGLALATRNYVDVKYLLDGNATWRRSVQSELPDWLLWGMLGCCIAVYSRWVRRSGLAQVWKLALHVTTAFAVALLHVTLAVSSFMLLSPIEQTGSWLYQFRLNLAFSFHWNVLIYSAVVLAEYAIASRLEAIARKQQADRLQADLIRSRLETLQLQLQPHFLFNSLNTVAELVHERPEAAEQMIIGIATLLRESLANESHEVTLCEELQMIQLYLSIEEIRFEDRLRVRWSVDAEAEEARLPRLLLQPIIENAVRHGLNRVKGGTIEILASRHKDRLVIRVRNSESPFATYQLMRDGIGWKNTRDRLRTRYGQRQHFACYNDPDSSAVVHIEIPWQTVSDGSELQPETHGSLSC